VLRELDEETGLTGTIAGVAGIFSWTYRRTAERPWDPVHHLGVVFTVEAGDGEPRHETGGSTDFCAWVPLEEVASLPLVPLARYAIGLIDR
jgi:8-oxo-dGTP diphosphatase